MALYFCILVLIKSITPGVEWAGNMGHVFTRGASAPWPAGGYCSKSHPSPTSMQLSPSNDATRMQRTSFHLMEQWPVCLCLWLEMGTAAFLPHCPLAPHEGPRQSVIKLQWYNGEEPHSTASFKCSWHLGLMNGQQKRQQCQSPSLLKEKHVGGDPGETL